MLLKRVRLQNIRSYVDETITFSKGSSLLSGDIGCGKSSILLAVEFALFGTSRPDLPAELLLRKGAAFSEVELDFSLKDKEIKIIRKLKKDKRGIKQVAGSICINGVTKELMPIELRAEVISLLGYPEDLLTKNKNYIFRYTVYTPQEEMKFILQENSDVRLDVLRKIFGIDKYRVVRENVLIFCKKLRGEIAEFKIRVEPLPEFRDRLKVFSEESEIFNAKLLELEPKLNKVTEEKKVFQVSIDELELKQNVFLQKREELKSWKMLLESKVKQEDDLVLKLSNLEVVKVDVESLDSVKLAVVNLESEKDDFLRQKTTLQEKINYLQEQIKREKSEITVLEGSISGLVEVEKKVVMIVDEVKDKAASILRQEEVAKSLETINFQISTHNVTLGKSKEICLKIDGLDNCPFCLQEVGVSHKENIISSEQKKIEQADGLLIGLVQQQKQLLEIQNEVKNKIDKIIVMESNLVGLNLEVSLLKQKDGDLVVKRSTLKSLVLQNNQVMPRFSEFSEEKYSVILDGLVIAQEKLTEHTKREVLRKHAEDLSLQLEIVKKEVSELKLKIVSQVLGEDFSLLIIKVKQDCQLKLDQERVLALQQVELKTNLANVAGKIVEISEKVTLLQEYTTKLIKLKETHHWLMEYFVKLTYTIEKHVMSNIHYLFNDVFKQWFAILIDDDGLQARIDDGFSPVLMQNGYEISFGNLSGGERTSAALAYRLALNRVINDVVHQVNTKGILILDEPTDGFSSEQLDKVRDVLDRLNLEQTIIVSHESKIESFVENVIRIGKEGHRSYVIG